MRLPRGEGMEMQLFMACSGRKGEGDAFHVEQTFVTHQPTSQPARKGEPSTAKRNNDIG